MCVHVHKCSRLLCDGQSECVQATVLVRGVCACVCTVGKRVRERESMNVCDTGGTACDGELGAHVAECA